MANPCGRALAALVLALLLGSGCRARPDAAALDGAAADIANAAVANDRTDRPGPIPGGALDTNCSHVAEGLGGPGYQFIATCPGRSKSPDGRFAVVQEAGEEGGVFLSDSAGRVLDDIASLADDMPFVVYWSPRSDWFFANHYLGSSLERLRVFEIVNRTAIERSAVFAEATREMVRRYRCLGRHANVVASGWRWSRDGRRIAMIVHARPDACGESDSQGYWRPGPDWHPLWMIGDVATGRIDPASVRVRRGGVGPMPKDGPYAAL